MSGISIRMGLTEPTLTSRRNISIVNKIWSSVESKSEPSEFLEDGTLVRPVVPVLVRLYPGITSGHNCAIRQVRHRDDLQLESNAQVGLQGCKDRASMKRCMKMTFPSCVSGFVRAASENPDVATRDA